MHEKSISFATSGDSHLTKWQRHISKYQKYLWLTEGTYYTYSICCNFKSICGGGSFKEYLATLVHTMFTFLYKSIVRNCIISNDDENK